MDVNNQGLNLPSNLQNLNVRNELLSKEVGSGASCAFSLRDLTGSNKKAVRVRRMPEDSTSSGDTGGNLNDERIFGGQEVQAGYVEDWVNGKLDNTLPCDVDTASAGYSLRKIKDSYSDNAVRIRRASDNVEVNVAFDSDDKVSASSPITNITEQGGESGSTTATNLGDFITEDVNTFTDSSSQSWANIRSADSFETSTELGGEVNYRKFTPNSGTGTSALFGITSFFDVSASSTYTISGQVYVPSGQTTVNGFKIVNGTSGSSTSLSGATNTVPATDQWVDFSFTSAIPTATQLYINASKDQNAFFSPNGSDFIAFKDITVTATDSGATVHTWYDQTKDLTQLSTYYNTPFTASNFAVTNATEEYGTYLGRDNVVKITTTAGTGQRYHQKDFGIGAGESVRFTAQIYVPSTNTALDSFGFSTKFDVSGYSRKQGLITPAQDQWVDIDFNYVQSDDTNQRVLFWNSASSSPTASNSSDGDVIYFRNMVVTRVTKAQTNAVQDTSGSQPKIAENGALLDGILFDNGSLGTGGIHLQANTMTTGSATDNFVSAVIDRNSLSSSNMGAIISTRSGNSDGFTYGIHSNGYPQIFYTGNGNYSVSSEILPTSGKILLSFDKDSTVGTIHKNATIPTPSSNTLSGYGNSTGVFNIGTINRPTSDPANGFMGLMSEIIVYNSDQAENRFKIESNINNYYSLYNDEYEWDDATNTEWQNNVTDGTTTFTANGKDGFTITATGENISSFKYAITSPSTASNNYYRVSFNVDDPDGLFDDAQLRLTATGSGATAQTITKGFNTMSLRTGSSFQYMSINSDGGGSSKTATLSDFKISRIARNGFVETWYDQSENNDHASQTIASKQPAIVQNGGQCKLENGKPAIKGDGSDDHLVASYFYDDGEVTAMSTFSVLSNRNDTGVERAIISAGSGFSNSYPGFMVSIDKHDNSNPFEQRVNNGSGGKETSLLGIARDGDILGSTFYTKGGTHLVKATTEDGTNSMSPSISVGALQNASTTKGKLRVGASYTFQTAQCFNMFIAETMIFRSDLRNQGIEDEINQFYNIG